jgi:sec-independent protein translocase protein TatA
MQTSPDAAVMLGSFSLGGGEIILFLTLVLILFGAKKLPELAKGLGEGISRFRDALDDTANDAGRSVGGIYGKRAAQAITPDNQVAELYRPKALEPKHGWRKRRRRFLHYLARMWSRLCGVIRRR